MRILLKLLLCISLIGSLLPISSSAKTNATNDVQCFKHNIQLQLSDSNGFPVDGTQFWVTLDIVKIGNYVTIQFPVINFQTGQISAEDVAPDYGFTILPGGYLYTSDGFLPESLRPNDLVYRSIVAASNNGQSLPFSFAQDPATLPVPPAGYIVSITNAGALVVQCAGTWGNIIPPGPQILMPGSITYVVKPEVSLCTNYIIDPGFTNITEFTNADALDNGFRDSHVNDVFNGVVAWSWTSNANVADKTNGTMNLFVAIGSINGDGTLSIGNPIQLTDFGPEIQAVDTAITINRTNQNNIVVSYGYIDYNLNTGSTYRAVSFDGGKTWPINGPTNIQPTGVPSEFGDCRGVSSDKFGNIWYGLTNQYDDLGNTIYTPSFWVSTDGGDTFSVVCTAPAPLALGDIYDYPQYCFGGDGCFGNYGLWFIADYIAVDDDYNPFVGFIPITGLGLGAIGVPSFESLTSLLNVSQINVITASADGRVWTQGFPEFAFETYILPAGVLFKSPGAIAENYAGLWQNITSNLISNWLISPQDSAPVFPYIPQSVQSIIYDDARQALYVVFSAQYPDNSQNARLYFIISRDNGQTWSDPIDIATTDFANRGFQSMALDPVTGNLVFGWYDGRNDPSYESVQYMGAIIPAAQLDALVNRIPLSDPLYQVPPATGIIGTGPVG